MLVLAKFSERMMNSYTDECIKNMLTWNHVNKDEVKRSMTPFVFTLTSIITAKRNMMKILFLQQSSLVQAYRRLQEKTNKIFKHLQVRKVSIFPQISSEKKWMGKVLSLRLRWMNIFFVICTVWSSLGMNILRKRLNIQHHVLSDSMIVVGYIKSVSAVIQTVCMNRKIASLTKH